MLIRISLMSCICLGVMLVGCSNQQSATPQAPQASLAPPDAGGFLLGTEPEDAMGIIEAREATQDGDTVVVTGRIGGSIDPWIEGLAAFSLVDLSLKSCSDIEGDTCPTPWDYCCESGVAEGQTLVKVVDDRGNIIEADAREYLGLEPLHTLVVEGTAQRDESGNLTILASGIYVHEGTGHGDAGHSHDHDHAHDHDDDQADTGESSEG